VSDGGDDRDGAAGDGADDALVAEREQVLEVAAAAREDDDVDARLSAYGLERLDDRPGGARALDVRLGDDHASRREARGDRRQDVPLGGGVVARDEADPAREARQRPLPARLEQPLRGEPLLQPLECREVVAEPEPLDRERAQAELSLPLPELGPSVDVDALAVLELEPEPVELPARHRDGQAGAVGGILEREEHRLPPRLPPELRHLPLDPDSRQAREPGGDAAVERGDRVDLALAVLDRLDLHEVDGTRATAESLRRVRAGSPPP
jgi:hypothetical protein